MPLSILYQDDSLIAIDKPAGWLVHPSDFPKAEDLVAMKALRDQIGQEVHVLHRLDQPTSGVVLFALERSAAKKLRQAFEKRRIKKSYLAIVHGHPADTWSCQLPLRKFPDAPEKPASTSFTTLARLAHDLALVEARPLTGRFHQIRRHLLHDGHAIVGDFRYLPEADCHAWGRKLGIGTRMLLQAKALTFTHPITGEQLTIAAPVDPEIDRVTRA